MLPIHTACWLSFQRPCSGTLATRSILAQTGGKHLDAKPLKRFAGGVLEVVSDHSGDTYRTVYTVKLEKAVYVLHAFQKKSKRGIATPQAEMDLVKKRLQRAIEIDRDLKE